MLVGTVIRGAFSRTGALLVLTALTAFTGALLAAAPGTASAASVDDWRHEWEVLRLVTYYQSQESPPAGPMVYDLGDSITRESIVSDSSWTTQLGRLAGKAGKALPQAWSLAGHNQTFGMDEQMVAGIPATPAGQPTGIVLIGVGISRFIGPPLKKQPVELDPPASGQEPGVSAWQRHVYSGRPPLSLKRKRELVPRWMERRWAKFRTSRRANFAAITRVIKTCGAKGLRPVLLDQPLDMRLVGSGLDKPRLSIRKGCDRLVAKFGRRYGLKYVHFTKSVAIPTKDYWDMHHLFAPGARIWQTRLSREVVKLLPAQTL
jgi:hypothetical protein